jgi:AcrR family transcriptional regulator
MNDPVHAHPPTPARAKRGRPRGDQGRGHDPGHTIADIVAVATREFAEKGLAGARIDDIAEAMRTSKRMI